MSYTTGGTTPATRTEQVYEILRSELLNGGLHPGQKLKMVEFTERFGVSQSVIREALTRLTEQGLLIATTQRGFRGRDPHPGRIARPAPGGRARRPAVGDRDPGRAPPA